MNRLGIDIGSKTVKLALLDGDDNSLVYSDYFYHRSQIKKSLLAAVHRCAWLYGDCDVSISVTGSGGMRVSELFDLPFVQEVIALKTGIEKLVPDTDVVLEMGGEDTKLIYLTGTVEQRMNNVCAGGTGGFIDAMAGLMGVKSSSMQRLAMGATSIYPIASRCAVFAKSDVRPLLNSGAKKEDIAASVLQAVCEQAVAGLSAGRPIEGRVALLGGPFYYTPYLKTAFCKVTGIPPKDVVIPDQAHLLVAQGAALSPSTSGTATLRRFEERLEACDFSTDEGMKRLPALFSSKAEYESFCARHAQCKIPRADAYNSSENLFVGIDAGSTTLKVALINEDGALCAFQYDWNQGDLSKSLPNMLKSIYRDIDYTYMDKKVIRRSCVIGYGEDFSRAAFHVDMGQVETVAHLRAAREIEPDVDFLIDIGGQDIKCFYIKDGAIEDIVLNEACSSGCGSLFDSIARSMGYSKEALAGEALYADKPVELGTRCTTFMDSRVKHAQKEGAEPGDIAAGICYSTARNALFKVVHRPDFSQVGKRIVVQGGAFANDALLRAFELVTDTEVVRPDLSQIMGAWGAALLARDEWLSLRKDDPDKADRVKSRILSAGELDRLSIRQTASRCALCTNNCLLSISRFSTKEGREIERDDVYVTGNRCERGGAAYGKKAIGRVKPPDMIATKNALIAAFDRSPQPHSDVVVGVPKVLSLYESYPFWKTFFNELGVQVVSLRESDDSVYRAGMSFIPSESACYPSKLVFGHCKKLLESGATALFMPSMTQTFAREGLLGYPRSEEHVHECPLIVHMSDTVRGNLGDVVTGKAALVAPVFSDMDGLDDVASTLEKTLRESRLDYSRAAIASALLKARAAYQAFFDKLDRENRRLLARVDAGEFPGILVMGHPYHSDPGIGHGIDELLNKLGYAVFERVDYRFSDTSVHTLSGQEWFANCEHEGNVAKSRSHPNLQLVFLRSFGCGIDAIAADRIHDAVRESGRVYAELKIDQIVDLAQVRIRVRSLAYAAGGRAAKSTPLQFDKCEWQIMSQDEYSQLAADRERRVALERRRHLRRASHLHRVPPKERSCGYEAQRKREREHAREITEMSRLGFCLSSTYVIGAVKEVAFEIPHGVFFTKNKNVYSFASWEKVRQFLDAPQREYAVESSAPIITSPPGVSSETTHNPWDTRRRLADYSDMLVHEAEDRYLQRQCTINTAMAVERKTSIETHRRQIEQMANKGLTLVTEYQDAADDIPFAGYVFKIFFNGKGGLLGFRSWDEVDSFLIGEASAGCRMPNMMAKAGLGADEIGKVE